MDQDSIQFKLGPQNCNPTIGVVCGKPGSKRVERSTYRGDAVIYRPLVEETILAMVHAMHKIALYGTILGAFNIKYISRAPIMGQVLMDLVADIAKPPPVEMTEA